MGRKKANTGRGIRNSSVTSRSLGAVLDGFFLSSVSFRLCGEGICEALLNSKLTGSDLGDYFEFTHMSVAVVVSFFLVNS